MLQSYLIPVLVVLCGCGSWDDQKSEADLSSYEERYVMLKAAIQDHMTDDLELVGMTLSAKVSLNIRVYDAAALSTFMESVHSDPLFRNPELEAFTEFDSPGFVLIVVELVE